MTPTEEQLNLRQEVLQYYFLKNLEKETTQTNQFMNALMSGLLKDIRSHQVLSNTTMRIIINNLLAIIK